MSEEAKKAEQVSIELLAGDGIHVVIVIFSLLLRNESVKRSRLKSLIGSKRHWRVVSRSWTTLLKPWR